MNNNILQALTPEPIFIISIMASVFLPLLLLIISIISPKVLSAKNRLIMAIILSPLIVFLAGITLFELQLEQQNFIDLLTASLLYITAIMITYSAWSLVGYSFTLTVLNTICNANEHASLETLAKAFSNGEGLHAFFIDRFGVLTRMKLVTLSSNLCKLSSNFAYKFALLVRFTMQVYGIKAREGVNNHD